MHDSGERQTFETGAVRDAATGKIRPDLISPFAIIREGAWLAGGAEKYQERNWEKGIPNSRCFASLLRHIYAWRLGDKSEDHLAAVIFNAQALIHNEECIARGSLPASLDDLPRYGAEEKPPF